MNPTYLEIKTCFIKTLNDAGEDELAAQAERATTKADLEALMDAAGTDSNLSRQLHQCWNSLGERNPYPNFDV